MRAQRREMELLLLEGVWKENQGESTSLPRRNVTSQTQSQRLQERAQVSQGNGARGSQPGEVEEGRGPGGVQDLSKGLMGTVSP